MLNIKSLVTTALTVLMLAFTAYAADGSSSNANSIGESPEWVAKLPEAKTAKQLFVVAAYEGTTAWISMHNKDKSGKWQMIMSTPGFIGKNGLGKTKEGDG